MNKIQYIKLLEIRGVTNLEQGQSINDSLSTTGGEPTEAEMIKVNELAMKHYIQEVEKEKAENIKLKATIADMQEDCDFMRALEAAGVDNWEGYGVAQDIRDESN